MNAENIKIISAILTPIVILLLGIWAKGIATNHEKRIRLNDRIIEKRIEIYEAVGKDLNDIFVFLVQVGHWKDFTPQDIVEKKRILDKKMYVNRPYWSEPAFKKYINFMNASFQTFTGVGEDAKIKTYPEEFRSLKTWNDEWIPYFSNKKEVNIKTVRDTYGQLIKAFSEQFGFVQQ